MKKVIVSLIAVLVICASVFAQGANEKPFPSKDMTLIVPWNAGGSSDLIGRLLVDDMSKTLGVNISVVNNRAVFTFPFIVDFGLLFFASDCRLM